MTTMPITRIRRRARPVSRSGNASVYRSSAVRSQSKVRDFVGDTVAGALFFAALLVTIAAVYVGGVLLFL